MKVFTGILVLMLATFGAAHMNAVAASQIDSANDDYCQDMAAYYEISTDVIQGLLEAGISLEDVPVALKVSAVTDANPQKLAEFRARGDSWNAILRGRSTVRARDFYLSIGAPFTSNVYSPIFEKFASIPQNKWNNLVLSDVEFANLANLRCISSQHDYSMFEVMDLRDQGLSFSEINREISQRKEQWLAMQLEKERRAALNVR